MKRQRQEWTQKRKRKFERAAEEAEAQEHVASRIKVATDNADAVEVFPVKSPVTSPVISPVTFPTNPPAYTVAPLS